MNEVKYKASKVKVFWTIAFNKTLTANNVN